MSLIQLFRSDFIKTEYPRLIVIMFISSVKKKKKVGQNFDNDETHEIWFLSDLLERSTAPFVILIFISVNIIMVCICVSQYFLLFILYDEVTICMIQLSYIKSFHS